MSDASYAESRQALHAVAELVLAGPQYRASGTIRLRVTPGGFGTIAEADLRVEGADLVADDSRVPIDGSTPARLAALAGVDAGAPEGLYDDGSGAGPHDVLRLDPRAVAELADAFAAGDAALRRFAPDQSPVLWPEHFDLAVSVDEVNYGVSPGDRTIGVPYAYVGPWTPRTGEFWNQPFGAAAPVADLPDLAAFFAAGRAAASG
jgi:hypothetical protein